MRTTTSRLPRSAGPMLVAATTLLLSVVPQLAFPQPALAVGTAQPAVPWSGRSSPTAGFGWPLGPPHPVLRRFDPPATRYGRGHRGVDLGGLAGQPVLAAGDGVVVYGAMVGDRPV